jgi:hypothetical protein
LRSIRLIHEIGRVPGTPVMSSMVTRAKKWLIDQCRKGDAGVVGKSLPEEVDCGPLW